MSNTMRGIVKAAAGPGLEYRRDLPIPQIAENEVLMNHLEIHQFYYFYDFENKSQKYSLIYIIVIVFYLLNHCYS